MIDKKVAIEIIETSLNDIKKKVIVDRAEISMLVNHLDYKHVSSLSGVRRSGKTYLIFQLIKNLLEKGKSVVYVNFENPRFDGDVRQLDILYQSFLEHEKREGKIYFFLDEIQNIVKWEKWVASMYEKDIKFFVTGSNASLLKGEFSTSLSGRHKLIEVYPLDFKQFLLSRKPGLADKKSWYIVEKIAEIKRLLKEYLHYGGFPEVVFNNRKDILGDYFEDILSRDIIQRYNLKYNQSLRELGFLLLTNISSFHSLYSLNKIVQSRSINTIKNYLMFLEDAYLIIRIPFFSFSVKKQLSNPFKIYALDVGMRNAVCFRFSEDIGKIYENVVAINLIRRFEKKNIFYWKNEKHEEVDFIVRQGTKVKELIQVCYEINLDKTKDREVKALLKASRELKCNSLLIITEDKETEEIIEKKKIKYVPLWKWLLEDV